MFPKNFFKPPRSQQKRGYIYGTPEDFLHRLPPDTLDSLTEEQLTAIQQMLEEALPKSSPKLVDIRWRVNLIFAHYYVVFLIGRDSRTAKLYRFISRATQIGNTIAYFFLLSLILFMVSYLVKFLSGIDLFPDKHLDDFIREIIEEFR